MKTPVVEKVPEPKIETPDPATNKRKPSFKEKFEFEQLEKDIAALEEEKRKLTELLNAGSTNHEDMIKWAEDIGKLENELDNKSFRWMELSELM